MFFCSPSFSLFRFLDGVYSLLLARSQDLLLEESLKIIHRKQNYQRDGRDRTSTSILASSPACQIPSYSLAPYPWIGGTRATQDHYVLAPFLSPLVKYRCPVDTQSHTLCTHTGVPAGDPLQMARYFVRSHLSRSATLKPAVPRTRAAYSRPPGAE
jgi:hypothetical protein